MSENDNLTDFEKSMIFSKDSYPNMEGKLGFDLFVTWRDNFLNLINDDEFLRSSDNAFSDLDVLRSFQIFDQAYFDNIFLSIVVKLSAKDIYKKCSLIIDKYVKPHPRSEGCSHLYQEASGLLVFILVKEQKASIRQAVQLVSQIFGFSPSIVEGRFRDLENRIKLESVIDNDLCLLVLYGCLMMQSGNFKSAKPIAIHERSKKEFEMTVNLFDALNKKLFYKFAFAADELEACGAGTILYVPFEEMNIDCLKSKFRPSAPDIEQTTLMLAVATSMRLMPNFLLNPHEYLFKNID